MVSVWNFHNAEGKCGAVTFECQPYGNLYRNDSIGKLFDFESCYRFRKLYLQGFFRFSFIKYGEHSKVIANVEIKWLCLMRPSLKPNRWSIIKSLPELFFLYLLAAFYRSFPLYIYHLVELSVCVYPSGWRSSLFWPWHKCVNSSTNQIQRNKVRLLSPYCSCCHLLKNCSLMGDGRLKNTYRRQTHQIRQAF